MGAPCSKSPNLWQALVYAAGMHLLVSSARHSFPSMVVGALIGIAYQTDFLGFKRLRVILARLHLGPQSQEQSSNLPDTTELHLLADWNQTGLPLACPGPISCEQILWKDDRQAAGWGWPEAACHHDRHAAKCTAKWGSSGTKGGSTNACKLDISQHCKDLKRIHVNIHCYAASDCLVPAGPSKANRAVTRGPCTAYVDGV